MSNEPDMSVLFPDCVSAVCVPVEQAVAELYPEEEAAVSKAVDVRKKEFAAGRACARKALANIGIHDFPLKKNTDGTVQWPPPAVGALTHSRVWCAAAVALRADVRGIGIDTESVSRISAAIEKKILTRSEREWIAVMPDRQRWTALVFSAKESVYKCLYTASGDRPGFLEICVSIEPGSDIFTAVCYAGKDSCIKAQRSLAGKYLFAGGEVFTGVVMPLLKNWTSRRCLKKNTRLIKA